MSEWLEWITKAITFWQKYFDERYRFPKEYRELEGLPEKAKTFDPFLSSKHRADENVWSRQSDLAAFERHLIKNVNSHTIITGASGTGKTTFLRRILQPRYETNFLYINVYTNFLSTLIKWIPSDRARDKTDLHRLITRYIRKDKPRPIAMVLQAGTAIDDPDLDDIVQRTEDLVSSALDKNLITLLVFDQIERFLTDVKYAAAHSARRPGEPERISGDEILCLLRVMKMLRGLPYIRTVFAIRHDVMFESIDFLMYSVKDRDEADETFKYFYFYGINTEHEDAMRQVAIQFGQIDPRLTWSDIHDFLRLGSRTASNTFLIQLTGYMIENFAEKTLEIETQFLRGKAGAISEPTDLLPLFFKRLIAGFHKKHPSTVSFDVVRVVMLTIAIENRSTGEAISRDRVARLAHLPQDYVDEVVNYLEEAGVVHSDFAGNARAVRFAHDMLFDYIVESNEFTVRDDLHKAVERLSERRISDDELGQVKQFGRVWWDTRLFFEKKAGQYLGAFAVVTFMLYGAIVCVSAWSQPIYDVPTGEVCKFLFDTSVAFWSLVPQIYVDECKYMKWYYPVIYLMDCAWVSFIYKLDRGYLQYVLKGYPRAQTLSMMMPVIGAALGILMAFTPVLTVVPLTVVGFIMSGLLIFVGAKQERETYFERMNSYWGQRTLWNMAFTAFLMFIHSFMIAKTEQYRAARDKMDEQLRGWLPFLPTEAVTVKNFTFWATGILLIWFLRHIRPEQQNEVAHAARLASFDSVRRRQKDQKDLVGTTRAA